jgi:hypothetical protein
MPACLCRHNSRRMPALQSSACVLACVRLCVCVCVRLSFFVCLCVCLCCLVGCRVASLVLRVFVCLCLCLLFGWLSCMCLSGSSCLCVFMCLCLLFGWLSLLSSFVCVWFCVCLCVCCCCRRVCVCVSGLLCCVQSCVCVWFVVLLSCACCLLVCSISFCRRLSLFWCLHDCGFIVFSRVFCFEAGVSHNRIRKCLRVGRCALWVRSCQRGPRGWLGATRLVTGACAG